MYNSTAFAIVQNINNNVSSIIYDLLLMFITQETLTSSLHSCNSKLPIYYRFAKPS